MKILLDIVPSIFARNELGLKHNEALQRIESYDLPIFISLFVCFGLAMYIYLRYYKKLVQICMSLLSYSASQQMQREGYSFFRSFSIYLFIIYVVCGAIFFTDLNIYFGWFKFVYSYTITMLFLLVIIVIVLIKGILKNVFGLITKEKNANDDVFFLYSSNLYLGGLIMLILCLLLHYSNFPSLYLLLIGLGLLGFLFALRMVRMLVFGRLQYGFSIFHLVLYLCTVEIIPLAICVKIIIVRS